MIRSMAAAAAATILVVRPMASGNSDGDDDYKDADRTSWSPSPDASRPCPSPIASPRRGDAPPWCCRELCGVHGPQRQAGASPFLSDNIHDDWDPAEDARVGSRWCGGGGGRRRRRRRVRTATTTMTTTSTTRNDPPSRRRRRRRQGESRRLSRHRFVLLTLG